MHDRFSSRIREGLERLGRRLQKAKRPVPLNKSTSDWTALQRHQRGAAFLSISIRGLTQRSGGYDSPGLRPSDLSLADGGCCLLRLTKSRLVAAGCVDLYPVVHVEEGFGFQKSQLESADLSIHSVGPYSSVSGYILWNFWELAERSELGLPRESSWTSSHRSKAPMSACRSTPVMAAFSCVIKPESTTILIHVSASPFPSAWRFPRAQCVDFSTRALIINDFGKTFGSWART